MIYAIIFPSAVIKVEPNVQNVDFVFCSLLYITANFLLFPL